MDGSAEFDGRSSSRRQVLRAGLATAMGATVMAGTADTAGAAARRPASPTAFGRRGAAAVSVPLTTGWRFGGRHTDDAATRPGFDDSAYEEVVLPHTVVPLSWRDWQPAWWEDRWIYRCRFDLPDGLADHRVFLDFGAVQTGAALWLDGEQLDGHLGGYLPFSREITGRVRPTGNVLAVVADSRWLQVPPSGSPAGVDYFQPGGIYRPVTLRAVPPVFVADVFAKPLDVLDPARRRVEVDCTLDAAEAIDGTAVVRVELRDGGTVVSRAEAPVTVGGPGRPDVSAVLTDLADVELWDVAHPRLYEVTATLLVDGRARHSYTTRIGFREARFEPDGFFLNGERVHLFGINRHQLYPYAGHAMPDRVQRRDAEILKHELNVVMVRCAHYPQHPAFLDACDELGLLVFEEIPGWQYIGDEAWQELAVRDVEHMVLRDRNRPSVVVWGVQINESAVRPELYTRTRDLAKRLDPTRQTTGAMLAVHHTTDGFVQDVFSYNDYAPQNEQGATLKPPLPGIPYLVSEAVGSLIGPHFYRRTDPQDVQAVQALLHAQVHEITAADHRYAGLLAWQAFDYQSRNGRVDHNLKCNGVADAFRVPKLGAAVYRAQADPSRRPVIEPAFYWDFGPGSPATGPGRNAMICANCDRLEVYVDGEHRATVQPDTERFGHLAHPPSFADLELSEAEAGTLPELRIDGYVAGRKVLTRRFAADPTGDRLRVRADDARLTADGSDATRVVFRAVDRHGAPRPFVAGDVAFDLSGPGVLVGDAPFRLGDNGGVGAVWVRTRPGEPGTIRLTAAHAGLGRGTVEIEATPPQSAR